MVNDSYYQVAISEAKERSNQIINSINDAKNKGLQLITVILAVHSYLVLEFLKPEKSNFLGGFFLFVTPTFGFFYYLLRRSYFPSKIKFVGIEPDAIKEFEKADGQTINETLLLTYQSIITFNETLLNDILKDYRKSLIGFISVLILSLLICLVWRASLTPH